MTSEFRISQMQDSSILYVYSVKDSIQIDPTYQRMSDVWDLDKRQLLMDSIINGFDIPKIYFHEFMPMQTIDGKNYKYAIVDGKQRLQSIWKFIENGFPLADDFEYLHDEKVNLRGLTYADLANKYPKIKIRFDSKTLPIITIQTEDIELIEDMFSRLNEAVPLSAPEKRNAFGGPLPRLIRELSKHIFFTQKLPFSNSRYRHYDLATKFLYFEHQNGFADTKKVYLDEFVFLYSDKKKRLQTNTIQPDADQLFESSHNVLDRIARIFTNSDPLLRSVGMVTLYYLLFKFNNNEKWFRNINRRVFGAFEDERKRNKQTAEESITEADYSLLEFDRLTTSPNDRVAMEFRYKVLQSFLMRLSNQ